MMKDYDEFYAGDVVLQSGAVLGSATLAYATYGKLNDARDNFAADMQTTSGSSVKVARSTPAAISSSSQICWEMAYPLLRATPSRPEAPSFRSYPCMITSSFSTAC